MRRHIMGILAVCLLIAGGILLFLEAKDSANDFAASMCLRIGLVLAAIWLAYPELRYIPPWMYTIVAAATVIVVIQPKTIFIVIPFLFFIWLIKPKEHHREEK